MGLIGKEELMMKYTFFEVEIVTNNFSQ